MKVYLVGEAGCEHDMLLGVYANRDKALAAFHEHRIELLEHTKHMDEWSKQDAKRMLDEGKNFQGQPWDANMIKYLENKSKSGEGMYKEMIKKLSEEDPEKMDNFPHDTPYLREEEVIE